VRYRLAGFCGEVEKNARRSSLSRFAGESKRFCRK